MFFHNILNNPKVPQYVRHIIPETRENRTFRALRQSELISIPRHKTLGFKKSFLLSTIKHWNDLPADARSIVSKPRFKASVKRIFGTSAPPLYHSLGNKKDNLLLTRLRVNMSKLNSHQFQIQASESPNCACGYAKEDTPHFLLHCRLFIIERAAMFGEIYAATRIALRDLDNSLKLKILLHGFSLTDSYSKQVAPSVFRFIRSTKRFDS